MFAALFVAVLLASLEARGVAAGPSIDITVDQPISTDVPDVPHSESEMASNPRDPRNILASSFAVENARSVNVLYYSKDGGQTWHRGIFPTAERIHAINSWDSELAFSSDGTGYFIYETQDIGFWVTSTRDGGSTWTKPLLHKGIVGYDRSYAAVARGPWDGRLFVSGSSSLRLNARRCGQVVTATSDDRGLTWAEARSYSIDDSVGCDMSPMPMQARADGTIFTFAYGLKSGYGDGAYYVSPSFDGGWSYQPLHKIVEYHQSGGKAVPDPADPEKYAKSVSKSVFDPAIAGTALDTSNGRYRNRLYVAYPEWTGRRFVVKAVHSTTDWAHWSPPVTVNDDGSNGNDAIPQVAVNRDGVVAVIWTDRRNSPDNQCYQLGAAISLDGGKTFSRNYVHPQLTCAANPKNLTYAAIDVSDGEPCEDGHLCIVLEPTNGGKWSNGGDTQGLAANADGSFGVVWSNGVSGVQRLWYTAFRPTATQVSSRTVLTGGRADVRENLPQPNARIDDTILAGKVAHQSKPVEALPLAPVQSNLNARFVLKYTAAYSRTSHVITFNLRLKNAAPTHVHGPFRLTLVRSKNWNPRVDLPLEDDAGSGLAQKVVFWKFVAPNPDGILRPGESTQPRVLRWTLPAHIPIEWQKDALVLPSMVFDVTR